MQLNLRIFFHFYVKIIQIWHISNWISYKSKRDNIFSALIKRHKDGDLTIEEYHAELVKTNRDYDLPGVEQAALEASDSEEEES